MREREGERKKKKKEEKKKGDLKAHWVNFPFYAKHNIKHVNLYHIKKKKKVKTLTNFTHNTISNVTVLQPNMLFFFFFLRGYLQYALK